MNCAKAQSLMLDHLYGDLKPSRERALLRHLQECSKCSDEFEKYKATASSFAKLDMEEPPPGISAQLVAMAAEGIEKQKSTRTIFSGWNWKPAFASVAMATLAIIIVVKYVPKTTYPGRPDLATKSRSEAAKKQEPMPVAASRPPEVALETASSALSEDESATINRRDVKQTKGNGYYGLDNDSFGDDIYTDEIVSTEAELKNIERGRVGGKAGAVEEPDSGRLARPPQAPPAGEKLRGLGYLDRSSSSEPSGWQDPKDSYKVTHAGEEGSRAHADGPATTSPVEADYAEVNAPSAINEVEQPAVFAAKPKPKPMAKKPAEMKEEESLVVGGSIIVADSLEPERETAQEEQLRKNVLFDSGEFNEAVMDAEKAANGKLDRQLTADYAYKLGKTYQEQDDCEKALAVYKTIPTEHPHFDNMAEVYISIGECYSDLALAPTEFNRASLEEAKKSLAIVREKFPETSDARLEELRDSISVKEELLFEYAYVIAEGRLENSECGTAKALFKTMPDDRSQSPQVRLKQRYALADVYFAISRCYVEMGEFEDAISNLRFIQDIFPEKQEVAMQKINEITAMQQAVKKANEQPPSAATESSGEKAE